MDGLIYALATFVFPFFHPDKKEPSLGVSLPQQFDSRFKPSRGSWFLPGLRAWRAALAVQVVVVVLSPGDQVVKVVGWWLIIRLRVPPEELELFMTTRSAASLPSAGVAQPTRPTAATDR